MKMVNSFVLGAENHTKKSSVMLELVVNCSVQNTTHKLDPDRATMEREVGEDNGSKIFGMEFQRQIVSCLWIPCNVALCGSV